MNKRLLKCHVSTLALLSIAMAFEATLPVYAACTNTAPATGQTVNCTGAGNAAVVAPTGVVDVMVNVANGGSITGVAQTVTGANAQYSAISVNDGSTVSNAGTVTPTVLTNSQRDYVGVNLNGSNTTLVNNGTISATNTGTVAPQVTYRLYGVNSSSATATDFDSVQVTNNGTISVSQSGTGVARGIYSGENIDSMQIDNFGTISATRVPTAGNATQTSAVAGVDSDDDTDTLVVNNHTNATITATGTNTYAIGGRAQDYTIQNDGTITNVGGRAAILVYGGDDDDMTSATVTINNSANAQINGNVSITDTSPFGATLPTLTDQTRDSAFTNEGKITGSFIYGAGTHTLDNSGTITGSITVNQNVGAGVTGVGGASFTLTNEGSLGGTTGNITITDRTDSMNSITLTGMGFNPAGNVATTGNGSNSLVLSGVTNLRSVQNFSFLDLTTSQVTVTNGVSLMSGATLATTVFGPGGTAAAPSTNLGSITGALTSAGATTVVPTFMTAVHNGDTYQIASAATGTYVTSGGSALVSTTVSNASGPLLLTTNVRNANSVAGINQPGAQTLNALLAYNGGSAGVQELGLSVQSLGSDAAVVRAGNALSPIVNGADVQTPLNATILFNQQIDSRLDQFAYSQLPASGRSADLGVARPVPVYGVIPDQAAWLEGLGGGIHQGTINGVGGYTAQLVGVIGGYDHLFGPNLKLGGAGGYVDARVNENANLQTREGIQTYQGIAYAEYAPGAYYARGSVGYGGVDYSDTRQINFAGFNDTAFGSHKGNILTVRGEAGVPYTYAAALLVPYAAFTYGHLTQGGYGESSANGAAYSYQDTTNDSERSEVGGKLVVPLVGQPVFSYLFPAASSFVALEVRAAYVHEFGTVGQTVTAAFAGGNFFSVTGPIPNREMLDFGVGVKMGSGPVQLDLSYNGLARETYYEQVGLLRARYVY